ncbi:hypothetical protein D3C81_2291230 [compost metagenome]
MDLRTVQHQMHDIVVSGIDHNAALIQLAAQHVGTGCGDGDGPALRFGPRTAYRSG